MSGNFALYSTFQRYIIQSNSQHCRIGTILLQVVFNFSKIHNSKQFTTDGSNSIPFGKLYSTFQRYIIQSNSQQAQATPQPQQSCIQLFKDT